MGTLVEMFIGLGILMTGIFHLVTTFEYMQKANTQAQVFAQLVFVRNSYVNILNKQSSWEQIVPLNNSSGNSSNMSCLVANTDCAGRSGFFDIYDESGASVYSPTLNVQTGLTSDGSPCASFVPPGAPGDPNCPIKLNIFWEPICPLVGACRNPMIRIIGTFVINSPTLHIPNGGLNFSIIR